MSYWTLPATLKSLPKPLTFGGSNGSGILHHGLDNGVGRLRYGNGTLVGRGRLRVGRGSVNDYVIRDRSSDRGPFGAFNGGCICRWD